MVGRQGDGRPAKKIDARETKARQVFGPEQKGFTLTGFSSTWVPRSVPIIQYEIHGGPRAFRKLMRRRWRLTPLANPVTGISYHIIRLLDKLKPGFAVDLLFRDTDAYLVAFRRQRLCNGQWYGNDWFKYSDVEDLPEEIEAHAVNLGFDSSHGPGTFTTAGCFNALHNMLEVLSSCEDYERYRSTKKLIHPSDRDRVEDSLLKAVVLFAEAFRFRSVYLSMLEMPRDGTESMVLNKESWNLVHDWGADSAQILDLWKADLPPMHCKAPPLFESIQVRLPNMQDPIALATLEDVIGENGEFMVLRADEDTLVSPKEKLDLSSFLQKNTTEPVPEPGFD
ncbi:hypothetical protein BS78_06G129100 [Paspalum vaginatum]|nr:hypothetical protein BS78_06G129100 [Paspalum vaginatum]